MGTVFVVVEGQHGNNAENFYRMFPAETVLPDPEVLQIEHVDRVSPPSLYTLLRAIVRRRDREVVIISHGSPTQLAMRVMPGIDIGVDLDFVRAILGTNSNADLARLLNTRVRKVVTLRELIGQVQRLRLSRLELRACRIGQSEPMLNALRQLFGANSICAPQVFDGYGRIQNTRPTTNTVVLTQWQSTHRDSRAFGSSPNRFFWITNGRVDPPVISDVFAESWGGVRAWVEAKFASGVNHKFRSGTFYYHMQTDMLPDSRTTHGNRTFESDFSFPNDAEYRQNLVEVGSRNTVQPASTPTGSGKQSRGPINELDFSYATLDSSSSKSMQSPTRGRFRLPGPEGLA